jgi:hypothetical protein
MRLILQPSFVILLCGGWGGSAAGDGANKPVGDLVSGTRSGEAVVDPHGRLDVDGVVVDGVAMHRHQRARDYH